MWVGGGYLYIHVHAEKRKNLAKESMSLKQELYNDTGCTAVHLLLLDDCCIVMNCEGNGGSGCDVIWSSLYLLGRPEEKHKKLLSGQMMSG
jgi:hypothetical protein